MHHDIVVESRHHEDWCDITGDVQRIIGESGATDGVVTLFVPHTTAAITVQENADPPLKKDIDRVLSRLVPWDDSYRHCEDNAAAHVKAMLVGPSLQLCFAGGKLRLGTWQAIYLCEFDGPRSRQIIVDLGSR